MSLKKFLKKIEPMVIGVVILIILFGYPSFAGGSSFENNKTVVVGFSMNTLDEHWQMDKTFFEKRMQNITDTKYFITIANNSNEVQTEQIRELIEKEIDVLIVVPYDVEGIVPVLEEAHSAGIKIISYSKRIESDCIDYYLGFDLIQVGELEARGVENVSGKIVYLGGPLGDRDSLLLREGVMNILKKRTDIEVVLDASVADSDSKSAYLLLKEYLKEGEVDGVVAANDALARGAIKALEEANLSVPVSGGGADLLSCRAIVEGKQSSTVYLPNKDLAIWVADISVLLIRENVFAKEFLAKAVFVNKENINETVLKDGFYLESEIY